jgi:glycosyltransferase involved in cell wall biosynthesis
VRIAWFSPAAGESGVVEYSRRVLEVLQRVAEPVLFCAGTPEGFPGGIRAVDFTVDRDELGQLGRYDAVVYNLGNNYRYHGPIWDVARSHPGILVLHDRVLHHFFVQCFQDRRLGAVSYLDRVNRLYGPAADDVAGHMLDPQQWGMVTGEQLLQYSFIEEAVRVARGVVVHSRWHGKAVRRAWSGPLCELWLPAHDQQSSPAQLRREDGRAILLTLGHVEFNKHVDKVVQAFAHDLELSARARYLIAGAYHPDSPYVRELSEQVAGHSLAGTVNLIGYLSPAELVDHAAATDVFVNLRQPNFEGSSASLMYELAFGKPVVVYRSGSFAELPDDVVVKVTPGDELDLLLRLRELVDQEGRRAQIGAAARRFAERRSTQAYVGELLAFATEVGTWTPRAEIAEHIGQELAALGADRRLNGVERVAREAVTLFGLPRS